MMSHLELESHCRSAFDETTFLSESMIFRNEEICCSCSLKQFLKWNNEKL